MSAFSSSTHFPNYHACIHKKNTLNFSNWLPKTSVTSKATSSFYPTEQKRRRKKEPTPEKQSDVTCANARIQNYKFSYNFTVSKQHFTHSDPSCFSSSPLPIPLNNWQVSPENKQKQHCSPHECRIQLSAFGPECNKKLTCFRVNSSLSEKPSL